MKITQKASIVVTLLLLSLAVIAFSIIPGGYLYGQAENDDWVPNMIGTWTGEGIGYYFLDVTDPASQPLGDIVELDRAIIITEQKGRVFAGSFGDNEDSSERFKLTGVIMPDRTVSIQYFEPSEEHIFFSGRLSRTGGTLQISAVMQFFDDFNLKPDTDPLKSGDRMMASAYVKLVKVN